MHRVDRFPRRRPASGTRSGVSSVGLSVGTGVVRPRRSSRPAARERAGAATARQAKKSRLKIRAASQTEARPAARKAAAKPAAAVKIAEGTDREPQAAAADQRSKRPVAVVETVEIRPSGTVVSRRPIAKRPAIHHVPHHPVLPLKPPAWMLEECHVAPARAGDQSEILQLLAGLQPRAPWCARELVPPLLSFPLLSALRASARPRHRRGRCSAAARQVDAKCGILT